MIPEFCSVVGGRGRLDAHPVVDDVWCSALLCVCVCEVGGTGLNSKKQSKNNQRVKRTQGGQGQAMRGSSLGVASTAQLGEAEEAGGGSLVYGKRVQAQLVGTVWLCLRGSGGSRLLIHATALLLC